MYIRTLNPIGPGPEAGIQILEGGKLKSDRTWTEDMELKRPMLKIQ